MLGIIGFVLTVGIIVVIHEWGHYIVARMAGVKILAFSFGFGKVLLKRTDKRGCEWRLSMWPLGGYVKMLDTAEKEDLLKEGKTFSEADWANAFDCKSVWRRFAVVFAGPAMNLILPEPRRMNCGLTPVIRLPGSQTFRLRPATPCGWNF